MKISSIDKNKINQSIKYNPAQKIRDNSVCTYNLQNDKTEFKAIANSDKLKTLFEYGIPCMYSGTTMIDSRKFETLMKKHYFSGTAKNALKNLHPFSKSFNNKEKFLYHILSLKALFKDFKNIQEEVQTLQHYFEGKLIQLQLPVLEEMKELSQEIPEKYRGKYNIIMENAYKKIENSPITLKFSTKEFIYKLVKAKEDFKNTCQTDEENSVIDMLREASKLSTKTDPSTMGGQRQVLKRITAIYNSSPLNGNKQIKKILEDANIKLQGKPLAIPFTRKSFIYDIMKAIDPIKNEKLKNKVLATAQKLPSSSNSFAAYIVKISKESPDKIAYRLAWPSFASVEHIHPKSLGGKDEMKNFGGATTKENSERQNIDFLDQLKRRPKTPKYCQKYIDRLLFLKHKGVFKKHNIDPIYIEDFANAIFNESKGKLKLNTKEPWYYKFI